MKPIEFEEANVVWAKHQKGVLPLPAYSDKKHTITKWRLTWRERFKILFTGTLWLLQRNFGHSLQAQKPTADYPFIGPNEAMGDQMKSTQRG